MIKELIESAAVGLRQTPHDRLPDLGCIPNPAIRPEIRPYSVAHVLILIGAVRVALGFGGAFDGTADLFWERPFGEEATPLVHGTSRASGLVRVVVFESDEARLHREP